ncbi:hypothetical protein D3C81_731640 [compost metagenome]
MCERQKIPSVGGFYPVRIFGPNSTGPPAWDPTSPTQLETWLPFHEYFVAIGNVILRNFFRI